MDMNYTRSNDSYDMRNVTSDTDCFTSPMWTVYIELFYLGVVSVFGVPGNSFIILVQAKTKDKSSTDYFIMAMGIVELVCAGVNVPIRMLMSSDTVWRNIASPTLCAITAFVLYVVTMSSCFLLAAIAMDRYIRTCHPFNSRYNPCTAKTICIFICAVSLICGCPNLLIYTLNDCRQCKYTHEAERFKAVWDYAMAGLILVMFVIISFAYLNISIHICKKRQIHIDETLQMTQTETCQQAFAGSRPRRIQVSPAQIDRDIFLNKDTRPTERQEDYKPSADFRKINHHLNKKKDGNQRLTTLKKSYQLPVNRKKSDPSLIEARLYNNYITQNEKKSTSPTKAKKTNKPLAAVPKNNQPVAGIPKRNQAQVQINKKRTGERNKRVSILENLFQTDPNKRQRRPTLSHRIQRTTKTMFLITVVYILLWMTTWIRVFSVNSDTGSEIIIFARSFFLTGCFINPLIFICMSSRFREKAKQLLF